MQIDHSSAVARDNVPGSRIHSRSRRRRAYPWVATLLACLVAPAFMPPAVADTGAATAPAARSAMPSQEVVRTADPAARGYTEADFPRVQQIADGVYTYEQLRSAGDELFTTVSMFVVTDEGVLVADGQGSVEETQRLIDHIGEITGQPITDVVICSDHGDHTGGNSAFPAEARYWAHPTSAAVLAASAERAAAREESPPVRLATELIEDSAVLQLGDKTIVLRFLGRAHTGGDLTVHLPDDKVLFMSEAYLNRVFPAMRSAYPSEWVAMIEAAQALDIDVYVPGHGFVDSPAVLAEELESYRRALEQVIAEAQRLHAAGLSVDEAVEQAQFGDLESWTLRSSQGPTAIRRVYLEIDGELPGGRAGARTTSTATVIRADRMLDVVAGGIVEDVVVLVSGERITAVRTGTEAVPQDARLFDLGDVTLMPGFMDMHTHLAYDVDESFFTAPVTDSAADVALRAAHNAEITLMAGFTTVRDLGSKHFVDVALERARQAGRVASPRVVAAGHSLGITGGHCDDTGFAPGVREPGFEEGIADGVDEVVKAVRYQIKHGARVIKICATAGVLSFEESVGAQQFSDEEMRAIVEEAARHGIKVAAHAHGTEGIIAASEAGVASIEHGSILDEVAIDTLKVNGTYLVPTTYLVESIDLDALPGPIREKAEYVLPVAVESLQMAIQYGVPIAFGTDSAVYPHGDNAREFRVLVERGMQPIEALRAATTYAADLLGVDDRGLIEAGKLADLVAVPGNPLDDITVTERVSFVMLGGEVFKRE